MQWLQEVGKGLCIGERLVLAAKLKTSRPVRSVQLLEEETAEQPREDAHG